MSKRHRVGFVLTAVLVVVAFMTSAAPAQAVVIQQSVSQCPSGSMCLWSRPNYAGTLRVVSSTTTNAPIRLTTVKSFYNNRGKRAWIQQKATSGKRACISPRGRSSNVTGWKSNATSVQLSTVARC